MGQDEFDFRTPAGRAGKHEIDGGTRRVEWKFDHRRRPAKAECLKAGRRGWMKEDYRVAAVQFIENRLQGLAAEIDPVRICHQHYPIGAEIVEGEGDLRQRCSNVLKGQGGK